MESVAISGVFAPVNKQQEEEVAKWVREILGDIPISLSNEIGNIGILERENGAILNSALSQVGKAVSLGFEKALKDLGIDAQIYFSQNDGTLMNLEYTMKYPIFTIGCGITLLTVLIRLWNNKFYKRSFLLIKSKKCNSIRCWWNYKRLGCTI